MDLVHKSTFEKELARKGKLIYTNVGELSGMAGRFRSMTKQINPTIQVCLGVLAGEMIDYTKAPYFVRSFLYVRSIANAPRGAVRTIARTATVSTVSPHSKPIARGIPPIAA